MEAVLSSYFRLTRFSRRTSTRVFEYRAGLRTPLRRFDGVSCAPTRCPIFFSRGYLSTAAGDVPYHGTLLSASLWFRYTHPASPRRPSHRLASSLFRQQWPLASRRDFLAEDFLLLRDHFLAGRLIHRRHIVPLSLGFIVRRHRLLIPFRIISTNHS